MASCMFNVNGYSKRYLVHLSSGLDDYSNLLFEESSIQAGQFAVLKKIAGGNTYEAIRDPLGIEKLFYTETHSGQLFFSRNFRSLLPFGSKIYSIPAGSHVRIGGHGRRELVRRVNAFNFAENAITPRELRSKQLGKNILAFQNEILGRFDSVFSLFKTLEEEGWKFFIALSGGLDSTIIARIAAEYLKRPMACTLDLGQSEDAQKSIAIANHIGIDHKVFGVTEAELIAGLKEAPIACQDFRGFNVHCAVVNLILAKNIRAWVDFNMESDSKAVVLTGDLMNEYLCDYVTEKVGETEYYKLPRVGKKRLQEFLIGGLDTSDRELSPFRRYGLECIQPYAAVVDLYTQLSGEILEMEDVKPLINSFLVDENISSLIPKTKLRAQVGDRDSMGILGLCHREGYTDQQFMEMLVGDNFLREDVPIFVGKYDVEKFI